MIETAAQLTERNFLLDPAVNASVTWTSDVPLDGATFSAALDLLLEALGYEARDARGIVRVVPAAGPCAPPSGGAIAVRVTRLEGLPAAPADVVAALRPHASTCGRLAIEPSSRLLIVADRGEYVARIVGLLDAMR